MRKDSAVRSYTSISTHWVARSDRDEILRIERASFEHPWCKSVITSFLNQGNASALVARHEGRVVGYVMAERLDDALHIANLAVEPEMRRCGVGMQLVQRMMELLGGKMDKIVTEVRETNMAAIMFFKKLDFRCVKTHKDYYDDIDEDAYEFHFRLDWSPDGVEVLKSIMERDGRVVA